MKAGFIKHSFILLIVCVALLGADTNDTLINANQKIYKNLLQTLSAKKYPSDEIALQKALIYKLMGIDINATKKVSLAVIPKNANAYGLLFEKYMNNAIKKNSFKKRILQIKEKLKILKNDIDKTKNNNPSLYRKFMMF